MLYRSSLSYSPHSVTISTFLSPAARTTIVGVKEIRPGEPGDVLVKDLTDHMCAPDISENYEPVQSQLLN